MSADPNYWKNCNNCRSEINYGSPYWICSVSTCNRKPLNMVFCKMPCWDAHVPMMNHRNAWAEEQRAPSLQQWERELAEEVEAQAGKRRRRVVSTPSAPEPTAAVSSGDVLIVASKLKQHIRDQSGMNTSGNVMARLSDLVRELCTEAIRNAATDERKTVMDRDFPASIRDRFR